MNGDVELLQTALAVVAGLFFLCCAPYTFRVVGQYDERLLVKQTQVKREKELLTRTYHDLLADMDELLQKSAESASGLAERSFESKRRDFQRFLERAKLRYAALPTATTGGEMNDLLTQFRRFCSNWLRVFEECSIDPILCPKRVLSLEELSACSTIVAVADLCLERLRNTEVRFISLQRDVDAQLLRKKRTEFRRLTLDDSSARMVTAAMSMECGSFASRDRVGQAPERKACLSWITCGGVGCFCLRRSSMQDGFPKLVGCGCFEIALLSPDHMRLLSGFALGLAVTALQLFILLNRLQEDRSSHARVSFVKVAALSSFVEVSVALLCVALVLARFEDIDTVQQLEREVRELSRQNQEVEQQRDKMKTFWSNAQNLTELWLYRTVPRLDLYKELHSQLEDTPQEDLLVNISGANQWLEDLEAKLGSLEAWRNDGTLRVEHKKRFGKAVNQLCQEHEFGEILAKLEDVTTRQLEQMVPPPSRADSIIR